MSDSELGREEISSKLRKIKLENDARQDDEKDAVATKLRNIAKQQANKKTNDENDTAVKLSNIVKEQQQEGPTDVATALREITESTLGTSKNKSESPTTPTKDTEAKVDGDDRPDEESEEFDSEEDSRSDLSDEDGQEFIRAAQRGDVREMKRILGEESNPNYQDRHGWTALHISVSCGHENVCKFLLGMNANTNLEDNLNRWTSLHLAAIKERYRITKLLLHHGAKKDTRDKLGDIPLDCVPPPQRKAESEMNAKLRELLDPSQ